jgi:hypothetical protein
MAESKTNKENNKKKASKPVKFKFNTWQSRAITESSRAKEIADKYVKLVQLRIEELQQKSIDLKKEANELDLEVAYLNQEMKSINQSADTCYSDLLKEIVDSFDTPPAPWSASLKVEEGVPVGVELLPE